ncbi:MAG: histidinol-phosphate transaminase [Chloroflexota bacterium]
MSPTPVSMSDPTAPAGYTWEATSEQVSARYGVPLDRIVRFDLNTSPEPPELAARILAGGRFETSLSEYPPSDYRQLTAAAAERYGVPAEEILVGAGADEILDIAAKTFLPPGGTAVIPTPSYAMYRVLTEQRPARVRAVPRLGSADGYAIDLELTRTTARRADLIWLCSPNNPTARAEPEGAIARLLAELAADAERDGRSAPVVVLDEAYAEYTGTSLLPLRSDFPGLIVVRTLSKAYALAGLRVGFGIAARRMIAAMEPFRPPGSVSTVSVTLATAALRDGSIVDRAVERVSSERERLSAALGAAGWPVGTSDANFVLIRFDSSEGAAAAAEGLLRRGLVPRTFPSTHPLADHLRLTVRSPDEDDRLIAAATDLRDERREGRP